jgi:hypothetical protein
MGRLRVGLAKEPGTRGPGCPHDFVPLMWCDRVVLREDGWSELEAIWGKMGKYWGMETYTLGASSQME